MNLIDQLRGIIPPLITPMDERRDVCSVSVRNLIEFVRPFSSALIPLLTTGEGWKLNTKQWLDMLKYTLDHSQGLPVLTGVLFSTTDQVVEYGLMAKQNGASAIVVTTPLHQTLGQSQIYDHFLQIATNVDCAMVIYHEQGFSGNRIELETFVELCRMQHVVGIKEASGDVSFTNRLIQVVQVPVFQGWEHLALSTHKPAGFIFPLANLEPRLCWEMYAHPSVSVQKQLTEQCNRYDILDTAPHRNIKKRLKEKEIILSEI